MFKTLNQVGFAVIADAVGYAAARDVCRRRQRLFLPAARREISP